MFIYGKNPVKDFYTKRPEDIKEIYIEKKRHQSFYKDLEKAGFKLNELSKLNFRDAELNGKENLQGIVARIKEPKIFSLKELLDLNKDKERALYLILDQVEDPQNFGAILRNAAAFGIDGVIYPSRNSARLNSTAMKTSAGNWMNVNLCETASLNQVLITLKDNGVWIAATSLEANQTLEELKDLNQPLAIILGNEGKGVRPTLLDKAEFKVKIDMDEKVESLNVSAASAIILHQLYRK